MQVCKTVMLIFAFILTSLLSRLLDQAASGSTQGQEEEKSHRFLVQIKTITDDEFSEIKAMSASQKMDEV